MKQVTGRLEAVYEYFFKYLPNNNNSNNLFNVEHVEKGFLTPKPRAHVRSARLNDQRLQIKGKQYGENPGKGSTRLS